MGLEARGCREEKKEVRDAGGRCFDLDLELEAGVRLTSKVTPECQLVVFTLRGGSKSTGENSVRIHRESISN